MSTLSSAPSSAPSAVVPPAEGQNVAHEVVHEQSEKVRQVVESAPVKPAGDGQDQKAGPVGEQTSTPVEAKPVVPQKPLTVEQEKKQVKKSVERRLSKLEWRVAFARFHGDTASDIERFIQRIRELRALLAHIATATAEQIHAWWVSFCGARTA